MSRRRVLAPAIAFVLLAACEKPVEQAATPPATPLEPSAPALSAAPSTNVAAAVGKNAATVCKSYKKKQGLLKAALAKSPTDATLQAQAKAIAAIAADACN